MMHRLAHELLRRADVLNHVWHSAGFAQRARVVEQLDAHLRVGRMRVEVLHAVDRELLAGRRCHDKIRLICPISTERIDRKSTRLNSSHGYISYAVFCLKKKK